MCIAVCDGLKGLPEAITTEWPLTVVQTCLIHLLRNAFRYASRQYWDEMSRDLRPISPPSTACREVPPPQSTNQRPRNSSPSSPANGDRDIRRSSDCGTTRGARTRPFLDYDPEIRRVICSTDVIVKSPLVQQDRSLHPLRGRFRAAVWAAPGPWSGLAAGHRAAVCLDLGVSHPMIRWIDPGRLRARCDSAAGAAILR
nr:transposase [Rhodococcus opacus]